jgi:hypothetical protein
MTARRRVLFEILQGPAFLAATTESLFADVLVVLAFLGRISH